MSDLHRPSRRDGSGIKPEIYLPIFFAIPIYENQSNKPPLQSIVDIYFVPQTGTTYTRIDTGRTYKYAGV